MKILDSNNNNFDNLLNKLLLLRKKKIQSSSISVTSIVKDVKKNGDKALLKYEKRFNRNVRMLGSGFFTLFHIFRMAVVMSLTGLALASATPLTPYQSVIVMGVLSIIYCALGGIEAVIWTDTIQTIVLLG